MTLSLAVFASEIPEPFASNEDSEIAMPETELSIYPNPVRNDATVKFSAEVERVAILNLVGREVVAYSVNSKDGFINVNLTDLEPGVYFITAQSDGRNLVTKRFLKEQ